MRSPLPRLTGDGVILNCAFNTSGPSPRSRVLPAAGARTSPSAAGLRHCRESGWTAMTFGRLCVHPVGRLSGRARAGGPTLSEM